MITLFILCILGLSAYTGWYLHKIKQRKQVFKDYASLSTRLYFSEYHTDEWNQKSRFGSLLLEVKPKDAELIEVKVNKIRFVDHAFKILHFSYVTLPCEEKQKKVMRSVSISCPAPLQISSPTVMVGLTGSLRLKSGVYKRFIIKTEAAVMDQGTQNGEPSPQFRIV
ncbi:MAG TPA: hypothetical protein VK102_02490 [Sphingobacterium sp.]|nr:hypothetical protein [Sphingobacterium sp.]